MNSLRHIGQDPKRFFKLCYCFGALVHFYILFVYYSRASMPCFRFSSPLISSFRLDYYWSSQYFDQRCVNRLSAVVKSHFDYDYFNIIWQRRLQLCHKLKICWSHGIVRNNYYYLKFVYFLFYVQQHVFYIVVKYVANFLQHPLVKTKALYLFQFYQKIAFSERPT